MVAVLSRQSDSTTSLPTNKKKNSIIALRCLPAPLETLRTRIVGDWIRAYESAS